ncbi:MAG: MFS transporter [Myxococcota bacterium]|nr:MFS transporter [Myxococcota bacterium]
MVKTRVEESLGANPGDAALNPADSVAMGVPGSHAPHWLETSRGRPFRALAHRPYKLLMMAFLVNQTGFWISHLSLQQLMVDLTNNDPLMVGVLFFALFIPAFLLAPLAGVTADRFDRKQIVLASYLLIVAVSTVLATTTLAGLIGPPLLLALASLMGTGFAFAGPANMAIAANAVPFEDLPSAISLQSVANNSTRVFGPTLAAPLIAGGALGVSFGIYAVAASIGALLISRIEIGEFVRQPGDAGIFSRIRSGFEHARERRPSLAALGVVAVLSIFGGSHIALIPVFNEEVLGTRELFPWMMALTGVGALCGSLVTGFGTRSLRATGVQTALYALCIGAFATTRDWRIALATQMLSGFFFFWVMTNLQTVIQQAVADSNRGRVMSLFQVCWAGLLPFGGLGMGATANAIGVVHTLEAASAITLVFGVVVSLLYWRR